MNLIGLFTALEHPDVWEPGIDCRKLAVEVRTQFGQFMIEGVRKSEDGEQVIIETVPVPENAAKIELEAQFSEYMAEAAEHEDPDVLLTPTERVKDFALYVYMTEDSQFSQLLALWTEFDDKDLAKFAQFVAKRCTEPQGDIDDGPRHWLGKE